MSELDELIRLQQETNRLLQELVERADAADTAIRSVKVNWNHPLMRLIGR